MERPGGGRATLVTSCERLVVRWLEADRLEAGPKAFRQTGHVEIRGAEERATRAHAIKVGEGCSLSPSPVAKNWQRARNFLGKPCQDGFSR